MSEFAPNEMSEDEERQMAEWLEGRPEVVRRLAHEYPPQSWWHMTTDSEAIREQTWYTPVAYTDDGTLKVRRYSAINPMVHDVFGVNPDVLVPADPPPDPLRSPRLGNGS